ncbi:hypothetical protein A6V36_29635 [Paraburkholderia ginsengiterrae]|uniref:Uncharacterized protein n=1 Tax=Paraburkholderia ginsengiterrae TaxID=1462993 RepID=A0A1A9NBS2_9BURK|nr:hypothetical protein [Paraburkholderia ginsengiterrae]OAJ58724.1 hypothetical protein A6V36_29635 [Paraburkholderia ginsengiterrae]OAJ63633.1 hypothetical protein A6V37_20080 [Paraburkholderia ginsengiterrae]
MSVVSKPTFALRCKRLAGVLAAVSLCALTGACSDDDKAQDSNTISSTKNQAGSGNGAALLPTNPSSASATPAALTIQTPARPASSADPALSAAASRPLATPVIHTVD